MHAAELASLFEKKDSGSSRKRRRRRVFLHFFFLGKKNLNLACINASSCKRETLDGLAAAAAAAVNG